VGCVQRHRRIRGLSKVRQSEGRPTGGSDLVRRRVLDKGASLRCSREEFVSVAELSMRRLLFRNWNRPHSNLHVIDQVFYAPLIFHGCIRLALQICSSLGMRRVYGRLASDCDSRGSRETVTQGVISAEARSLALWVDFLIERRLPLRITAVIAAAMRDSAETRF
jgi:hypothetical protein